MWKLQNNNLKAKLNYVVIYFLILFSSEAQVSQNSYETIRFSELNTFSPVVVVVKRHPQPTVNKSIEVIDNGKSYSPLNISVNKFIVDEVLRGDNIAKQDEIIVYPAGFDNMLDIHKRYVIDGMSTSPLYDQYEPQAYNEKDDKFILFITFTAENQLAYYCLNSVEGLVFKDRVSDSMGGVVEIKSE